MLNSYIIVDTLLIIRRSYLLPYYYSNFKYHYYSSYVQSSVVRGASKDDYAHPVRCR